MTKEATPRGADSVTTRGRDTKSAKTDKLTAKQAKFVEEYMVDLNATQADIRAGYSQKTAQAIGSENLRKPLVAAAIEGRRIAQTHANGITVERILKEQAAIAFFDLRKLYRPDGSLKNPAEWDDETAAAMSANETVEMAGGLAVDGSGAQHVPMYTKKVKGWDKGRALEALLKHLGASGDKPNETHLHVNVVVPGLDVFAAKLAKVVG